MAYLVSLTAWKSNTIDFNLPIRSSPTLTTISGGNITSFDAPLSIDGIDYNIPSTSVPITAELDLTFGVDDQTTILGTNLSFDAGGVLTGGRLQGIGQFRGGQFNYGITGYSINAATFGAAQATLSNTDDLAEVEKMMRGNDLAFLSEFNDTITTGNGNDLVYGGGGRDRIVGGGGQDIALGEAGDDILTMGTGNDVGFGGDGADSLNGGTGNDTLSGGLGDDTLTGAGNGDRFVFELGGGTDTVTDFVRSADKILIRNGAVDFAGLTLTKVGTDTHVTFGDATIILQGIKPSTLNASHFLFDDTVIDASVASILNGWDYFV